MALTFTNTIDGGLRDYTLSHGLRVAQFDMTTSDVSVDYSSGFDINGNADNMGFHKIFGVIAATIRASAGTLRALLPLWDANTGKLRFYENAAAAGAFDEADVDVEMADNDVVRMVVIGV